MSPRHPESLPCTVAWQRPTRPKAVHAARRKRRRAAAASQDRGCVHRPVPSMRGCPQGSQTHPHVVDAEADTCFTGRRCWSHPDSQVLVAMTTVQRSAFTDYTHAPHAASVSATRAQYDNLLVSRRMSRYVRCLIGTKRGNAKLQPIWSSLNRSSHGGKRGLRTSTRRSSCQGERENSSKACTSTQGESPETSMLPQAFSSC